MRRMLIFTATILAVTHSAATPAPIIDPCIDIETVDAGCRSCPPLVVWTSRTCLPCRTFWRDMREDAAFREAMTTRFSVKWIDADIHHEAANRRGIHSLPTFEIAGRHIIGYEGKRSLWDSLIQQDANGWRPSQAHDDQPPESSDSLVGQQPERRLAPPIPLPQLERPRRTPALGTLEDDVRRVTEPPTSDSLQTVTPNLHRVEALDVARRPTADESPRLSLWSRLRGTIIRTAPLALTALELAGLLTGTAATGGLGMFAISVLWKVWSRRRRGRSGGTGALSQPTSERAEEGEQRVPTRAPFPRELDEARELLALRQSEGRVAVLDALRGMFLDDELTKLKTTGNDTAAAVARKLQASIDSRVDEVAPLSTTSAGA